VEKQPATGLRAELTNLIAIIVSRLRFLVNTLRYLELRGIFQRRLSVSEGSTLFMLVYVTSAAFGVVRQMLFNALFGTSIEANAYYAAFRLPETLINLIGGGALAGAMIPVILATAEEDGEAARQRLIGLVFTTMLVLFSLAIGLCLLITPWFVTTLLAPGFDPTTSDLTILLTRMMLFQTPLALLSSVCIAVLNSQRRFAYTALAVLLTNMPMLLGLVITLVFPTVGIFGATVGVIGESALSGAILLYGMHQNGTKLRLAWDLGNRRLRQIGRLLVPNGLSVGLNYVATIVDTAFATLVYDPRALPALSNALLVTNLPVRMLGVGVGEAVFPRMAAEVAAKNWRAMRRTLLQTLAVVVVLAIGAALALLLPGRWLVRFLFERGQFDASAGDLTYAVLVVFVLGLPAYISTEVLARAHIALWDTTTPLLTNGLQLIVRASILTLTIAHWGAVAIPAAYAISATVETIALATSVLLRLAWRIRHST
jgi:putative peptidoglycan lipid II flippase